MKRSSHSMLSLLFRVNKKMNYCNLCKGKLILHIPQGDTKKRYVCKNCHTIHYENPKMIVGTICVKKENNHILLCKRAIEPRKGYWTLPSGFMENGESTEEGAKRETEEEANASIRIDYLHTLYSIPHINQVHLFFKATLLDEKYYAGIESTEVQLFSIEEIPWKQLAFRSVDFCLQKYKEDTQASPNPHHYRVTTHIGTFSANPFQKFVTRFITP